jgi:hypothetical protein
MKTHKPTYKDLALALADLLATEECVCAEAELKPGTCSVCTYQKLLDAIPDKDLS